MKRSNFTGVRSAAILARTVELKRIKVSEVSARTKSRDPRRITWWSRGQKHEGEIDYPGRREESTEQGAP